MESFFLWTSGDALGVYKFLPLIGSEQNVKDWDVASIIFCHQIVMVNMISWCFVSLPVGKNRQYQIEKADYFSDEEVAGENKVTQEAWRHSDPELDNMIEGEICNTNHMLWSVPCVVIWVS